MKIETRFSLGQLVTINELDRPGKILSITVNHLGVNYNVRYCDQAEFKNASLYEEELQERACDS